MPEPLFTIHNLECGYNSGKVVLKIADLQIYSGQITFIVGKSGSGKSTMLETLGFMNNTFLHQDPGQVIYHDTRSGSHTDIVQLWKSNIENHSKFRNDNYSFIFQENNLLEHFCASENILIPMLMAGIDQADAVDKIRKAFVELHLPEALMERNTRLLSGGQRQRISFLRALLTHKPVLFGDEPTGNLDPVTARTLMSMVKKNILDSHRSAIIVSHDLPLAFNFADRILMLRIDEMQTGFIGSIFERNRNAWTDTLKDKAIEQEDIISLL